MEHNALTWSQRGKLWGRLALSLGTAVLLVWSGIRLLPPALSLSAPFLLAWLVAAGLDRPIRRLQKRLDWQRGGLALLAVGVLVGVTGGLTAALVYGLGGEVLSLAKNWEGLFSKSMAALEELLSLFDHLLSQLPPDVTAAAQTMGEQLTGWVQRTVSDLLAAWAREVTGWALAVPGFLLALLVFLMATYFLAAEYPYLRTRAIQHTDQRLLTLFSQVKRAAMAAFGGYLKAQLVLSVGVFLLLLGGFLLKRQSYALLLALGLAVLDFIPLLGAGTVLLPWGLGAVLVRDYADALWILLIWGVVAAFRRLAEPKIVGDQTGLSPVLSLASIYVGMQLAGVAGMVLGPILVLAALNLSGLGLFRPIQNDLERAVEDLAALLRSVPEKNSREY